MTELALTATEKFLLGEVFSMPDKKVGLHDLRRSARLTVAGFRRVTNKMEQRQLLVRTGDGDEVTLTFTGLRAARELGWED